MTPPPARNRRADAHRSRAAILDAAVHVLDADPDAGLATIAATAGVTRQTVYAHFPSRDRLLLAVMERITEESVAAMDAVDLDAGPAADTLIRLLDAGTQAARRHPGLLRTMSATPVSPPADHDLHAPVAARIRRVIRRGRETGEFDDRLPIDWLVAVTVKLGHTAHEEQDAGRMSHTAARAALRTSLLRVLDANAEAGCSGADSALRRR
jgi:AcrR family transcriptional regulator